MPMLALTAQSVQSAACPAGKSKQDYYDTAITGFILEVRANGGKTYALRYRDAHNRQRQYKIGDFDSISFDKARTEAEKLRSRVVLQGNPADERQAKKVIPTMAELAQIYLEQVRYKKSWCTDETQLRVHILPKWGKVHLDELDPVAVVQWAKGIHAQGRYAPATINRLLIIMRFMFTIGRKNGVPGTQTNPLQHIELLTVRNARERYLTQKETKRLQDALPQCDNPQMRYIVPLLLLTGMRVSELLNACWEHIDVSRRTWYLPVTKSGRPRYVPLSQAALAVLEQVPRFEDCPYVVPNPKTRKPFHSLFYSWDTIRKTAGLGDFRLHDLRHSHASYLINSGRSIYEVSKILGHQQITTTTRYAHLSNDTLLDAVDAAAKATGTDWAAQLAA